MKTKRSSGEMDERSCAGCSGGMVSSQGSGGELGQGTTGPPTEATGDASAGERGETATNSRVERRPSPPHGSSDPASNEGACGSVDSDTDEQIRACPALCLQTFEPRTADLGPATQPCADAWLGQAALTHWPVQIRLVPPNAPFLRNADLLVAADCTPFAYPAFHRDFLAGKVVLIGCPKFDEVQSAIDKFAGIFVHSSIAGVTVLMMEVPCCSGLATVVKRGMDIAGKTVPLELVLVSTRGTIIRKQRLDA
jgi:hypothetical protein